MTREKTTVSNQFSSSNFAKIVTSRDGKSGREGWREIECVSERARRTCCVTYAALQTSQIILSCICIMCIGMATHLDRKSTCTVIETNMVILFSAYLDYFSLTNQSREVTCDFGFASGVGAGCDGWYDDRDFLESSLLFSSYAIVKNNSIFPLTEKENIRIGKNLTDIEELFKNFSSLIVYQYFFSVRTHIHNNRVSDCITPNNLEKLLSYLGCDVDGYLHLDDVRAYYPATYFYFYAWNFCVEIILSSDILIS